MTKVRIELVRFFVAGVMAVLTDLIAYYLLLNILGNVFAKFISFIFGSLVAFLLNKYWTFEQKEKSYTEVLRFVFLYLSTLFVNVATNTFILEYERSFVLFSFIVATAISTVLNFLGQKFFVFRRII